MGLDHLGRSLEGEGRLAREHLVGQAARGVEVGALVDRAALDHLGGHVGERPADAACAAGVLHQAEVHQLDGAVEPHADVGRLEVAVHQAALVDVAEGEQELAEDVLEAAGAEGQGLVEAVAGDDLHGEVRVAVLELAVLVDPAAVRVAQLGHQPELLLEAQVRLVAAGARPGNDLQGHLLVARLILSQPDPAHGTLAEGADGQIAVGEGVHRGAPSRASA